MTRKKKEPASFDQPPKFEEAFAKLQELVRALESGQLTLDRSLDTYSQAIEQLRACYSVLEQAEQRIRLLVSVDEQGRAQTQPFDHQSSSVNHTWNQADDTDVDEIDEDDD